MNAETQPKCTCAVCRPGWWTSLALFILRRTVPGAMLVTKSEFERRMGEAYIAGYFEHLMVVGDEGAVDVRVRTGEA